MSQLVDRTADQNFVADVAHELKTPIGAMVLLSEALLMEPDELTTKRLTHRLHIEANRVARLLDDLLDLAQTESGAKDSFELLVFSSFAEEAMDRVRARAEHRRITLVLKDPDAVVGVGSRGQLVSALQHLLDNAVKYSPQASTVEVELRGSDEWNEIVVRDNGVGIAPQDHERIFHRFYRLNGPDSGAQAVPGHGLGLAIVAQVARNHSGRIDIASQVGQGAVFCLRIPTGPPFVHIEDLHIEDLDG